jgi:hypothetical protein
MTASGPIGVTVTVARTLRGDLANAIQTANVANRQL